MAFRRPQPWSNHPGSGTHWARHPGTRNQNRHITQQHLYDPIEDEFDELAQSSEYAQPHEYGGFTLHGESNMDEQFDEFEGEEVLYNQNATAYEAYGNEDDAYYAQDDIQGSPEYGMEQIHAAPARTVPRYYQGSAPLNAGTSQHQRRPPRSALQDYPRPQSAQTRETMRLRPVSHLPDLYRGIFKRYGTFNAVQSACFDDIMNTDGDMVISAPTGSGKTVLFELAIIKMHMQGRGGKCVYIAPTKALCTEKHNDWSEKFEPLGLKCYELTGDTENVGRSLWSEAKNASIIVTTGEKWDSVTRGWNDHQEMLSLVRLFLVDEVHVLGESRGSTLEVVVSRMKMRSASLRFVLVSATIPNIDDIAAWISSHKPDSHAKVLQFGEEYRPCKLARHVVGVKRHQDMNSFMFAKSLNAQLFDVIQTYSAGKPILIFDSTRKGVFSTAELLVKQYTELESQRGKVPWARPARVDALFKDKRLAELAAVGVGVHHAGLDTEDRRTMEQLYIQKTIRVLVATSTLAVGVNLPAHFVIIKGVHIWQSGAECEYSDLDIMQMLGRAGRPQFDSEGIAVIMCENNLVAKYQALTHGTRVLESCLHRNLTEHINSEIGMGTITDLESAKSWLRGSFFYQRVRKNPGHYAIGNDEQHLSWQERLDNIVLASIRDLRENQLIKEREDKTTNQLVSTEYGEIMSKFYIRQTTMAEILAVPKNATLRDLMEVMSRSEEFLESKLRYSEKGVLNALRKNPEIRFEIKKVETTADKIFVLTQAVLGGVSLNDAEYKTADCQFYMQVFGIFKHANRLSRAIVEVGIVKKNGSLVKHGLELVRCLTAKAWEDRPVVLRQIEALGEKSIKVLAENGVTNIEKLRTVNPMRIELLLKRAPPFGHKVVSLAEAMPRYVLSVQEEDIRLGHGKGPVEIELSIICGLANAEQFGVKAANSKGKSKRTYEMTSVLTISSDYEFIDYRRIQTKVFKNGTKEFTVSARLTKPSQSIIVIIASDTHAGCTLQIEYRPKVAASEFPVRDTRPITSTELDLTGLEDDPDFWKMSLDSSDDVSAKREPVSPTTQSVTARDGEGASAKKSMRAVEPPQPRKLANGNYECNHPCNDKSSCRHYCCRNGLPDRPPPPKKAKEKENSQKPTSTSKNAAEKKASSVQRLHSKSASIAPKKETDLSLLEKVHNNAGVSQSLRLSVGQRLKLESPQSASYSKESKPNATTAEASTSRKGKNSKSKAPKRNYELSFTDLGESSTMLKSDPISDVELSDDDLPTTAALALAPASTKHILAKKKVNDSKAPSSKKLGTPSVFGLKRRMSIISLSSSEDDWAPKKTGSVAKKRKVQPEQEKVADSGIGKDDIAQHDFGSPLFLRSDGDAALTPSAEGLMTCDTTLFEDIEDFLGCDSDSNNVQASQAGTNALESITTTQASSAQYDLHNFYPPAQKVFKSSAPPSIASSNTLRTESPAPVEDCSGVKEAEFEEEPLDDFADLEAWLQDGELIL